MNRVTLFLPVFLIAMFAFTLSAQQFDPFDFIFEPDKHILRPAEVLEHHVATCKISEVDGLDKVITYDGNGRVLHDDIKNHYHIYNASGDIEATLIYQLSRLDGQVQYTYDEQGQLVSINKQLKDTWTKEFRMVEFTWEDGKIMNVADTLISSSMMIPSGEELFYTYSYDENGELYHLDRKGTTYINMEEEMRVTAEQWSGYKNGVYTGGLEMIYVYDCEFDDEGRIIRIMNEGVITEINDNPETFELVAEYTYYPNGLVKSKRTPQKTLNYEYEYLTPATFHLKVPESLSAIRIWNFSQNSNMKTYEVSGGEATIELYIPASDLYLIQLSEQYMLPFLASPGQEINLTVTNESVSYDEADGANNYLLQIEGAKQNAITQDPENAARLVADLLIEQVKTYPEFMGFLFYKDLWDIQSEKQLFLDYCKKMIELYPHNFKAHEMHSLLSL